MTDERSTFETTKARLEDIVVQVRRKDVSLEQSLDMLEEAVRLVNQCNDLIDQTSWKAPAEDLGEDAEGGPSDAVDTDLAVVVTETVDAIDTDGDGAIDLIEVVRTADVDGDGMPDVVEVIEYADTDGDGVAEVVLDVEAVVSGDAGGELDESEAGESDLPDDERE